MLMHLAFTGRAGGRGAARIALSGPSRSSGTRHRFAFRPRSRTRCRPRRLLVRVAVVFGFWVCLLLGLLRRVAVVLIFGVLLPSRPYCPRRSCFMVLGVFLHYRPCPRRSCFGIFGVHLPSRKFCPRRSCF